VLWYARTVGYPKYVRMKWARRIFNNSYLRLSAAWAYGFKVLWSDYEGRPAAK